jgi:hypothetical protein
MELFAQGNPAAKVYLESFLRSSEYHHWSPGGIYQGITRKESQVTISNISHREAAMALATGMVSYALPEINFSMQLALFRVSVAVLTLPALVTRTGNHELARKQNC